MTFTWYNQYVVGRLSSNMKHTGNILINGHKQSLAYGISVRERKKCYRQE